MSKTYLLVLSTEYDRQKVVDLVDKDYRVTNWFYSLPYSLFVNTSLSAHALSDVLTGQLGHHKHFIVEVGSNRWGRLPKDHWKLFE